MKTPFYELAEKIGNEGWKFSFIPMYQDLDHDRIMFFLSIYGQITDFDSDNHRILALLFADLLWQDEMKGRKK